jgi:ABC-type amino acid transport system permease subunit
MFAFCKDLVDFSFLHEAENMDFRFFAPIVIVAFFYLVYCLGIGCGDA